VSEPAHAPPGKTKGTISIPGVGKLPTWAVLGGVGIVLVLIIRSRSKASAAAAAGTATDPAGNVGVIDPATGYVQGSPQDQAALAASAAAGTADTSGTSGGSVGTQVTNGPPFTSNAAWSQYAISVLQGNGYDPGILSAELGAYLNGQAITPAQQSDINAAVAVAGYPPVAGPNGKPPAINVSGSSAGGAGPNPSTGSPGSGSSSGKAAAWQYPVPQNLSARSGGKGKISVSWAPVVGPQGQRPGSYTVAYGRTSGAQTWKDTAAGTSITLTTAAGMTEYIEVWANGGPVAPPHAGPLKATAGS
jgi:hypothetical protein